LKEYETLVKRFFDELVLLVIELHDCLLQVTNTSMDELGRL
jgi:hypothetical protein